MSKQLQQQNKAVDTSNQVNLQTEPVQSKTQLKFPRIYAGPNVNEVGLKYGLLFSGPDYPDFIKNIMAKAPTLASMIFPVGNVRTIPDAVVNAFLSQIKRG